jgi:hypothetical protein
MLIHKYEEFIPDQNASVIDKINAIIQTLNQVGTLTNDVVKDWNTVYQWCMNDGLQTDVNNKIDEELAKGTFDAILTSLFTPVVGDLTALQTADKGNLVAAINDLQAEADSNKNLIGDLTTLTTADKDTLVHAINDNVVSLAQKAQQSDILARGVNLLYPPSPLVAPKGDWNGTTGTDDTTTIQNIINYCGTNKVPLFIPNTTFLITSISLPSNLSVYCVGKIFVNSATTMTNVISVYNASNINIYGLYMTTNNNQVSSDGTGKTGNQWSNRIGVQVSGSTNIKFFNPYFKNFDYGYKIDGSQGSNVGIIIDQLVADNVTQPIYVSNTTDLRLTNSEMTCPTYSTNLDHHIYGSQNLQNVYIGNCIFNGGAGIPLQFDDSNTNSAITNIICNNCTLNNTYGGVIIAYPGSNMIVNNITVKNQIAYTNGIFRAISGATLHVNGFHCETAGSIIEYCLAGGTVLLENGYVKTSASVGITGSVTGATTIKMNNVTLEHTTVVSNMVLVATSSYVADIIFDNCRFLFDAGLSNNPFSVRTDTHLLKLINCTMISSVAYGSSAFWNGGTNIGAGIIAINNNYSGFNGGFVHSEILKGTWINNNSMSPINPTSSVSDMKLTTTSATTVSTLTPVLQGNYSVKLYYRVVTGATNLTITLTYTDGSGSQTQTPVNVTGQAVGSYEINSLFFNATTGGAITVSATAGTANQVYVSATIKPE